MKDRLKRFSYLLIVLTACYGLSACQSNPQASSAPPPAPTPAPTQKTNPAQADIANQQKDTEQRARPDIEERRKQEQQEAEKSLDKEAMAAIAETRAAVKAIADNNRTEAIAAIERATGKINVLLARYPTAALIPLSAEVDVIDLAPQNIDAIRAVTDYVDAAVTQKDYPTARLLLHGLTSELRIRTYNLPLARYTDALREAARLLDQNKNQEASSVLLTTLNTLVMVDRSDPLPLILAQKEVSEAQDLRDKDKDTALKLLADSQRQLERAKELGYAGKDPEYAALSKQISGVEKQLKGKGETLQAFSDLKNKLEAFLKRQSANTRSSKQG
jgi:hypothetical protein